MGDSGDYWREHREHGRRVREQERDPDRNRIRGVRCRCGGDVELSREATLANGDATARGARQQLWWRRCLKCERVWAPHEDRQHMTGPRMGRPRK